MLMKIVNTEQNNNNITPNGEILYTLKELKISPYRDFIKLHFGLNKVLYLIIVFATIAILLINVFFQLLGPSFFNTIIYIFLDIDMLLIYYALFIIPALQKKKKKKKNDGEYIDFYENCLVVHYYKKVNDKKEEATYVIPYDKLKKKKRSKHSYLLFIDKNGILLSKDNDYPEVVKNQLETLTSKVKR